MGDSLIPPVYEGHEDAFKEQLLFNLVYCSQVSAGVETADLVVATVLVDIRIHPLAKTDQSRSTAICKKFPLGMRRIP